MRMLHIFLLLVLIGSVFGQVTTNSPEAETLSSESSDESNEEATGGSLIGGSNLGPNHKEYLNINDEEQDEPGSGMFHAILPPIFKILNPKRIWI